MVHHYQPPPAIVMHVGVEDYQVLLTAKLRQEYERRYSTLVIRPNRITGNAIVKAIQKIEAGKSRYLSVQAKTAVPWYVIGVIHLLECDGRFDCHLHNGDPLTKRTVHAPAGRPVSGHPPFSWEYSALDALRYKGLDVWCDWTISGTLYKLEAYNGFGYRNHGIASPYLWSGTTFYTKGKYILDGVWSPTAVSAQIGVVPILRTMSDQGLIQFPSIVPPNTNCEKE